MSTYGTGNGRCEIGQLCVCVDVCVYVCRRGRVGKMLVGMQGMRVQRVVGRGYRTPLGPAGP